MLVPKLKKIFLLIYEIEKSGSQQLRAAVWGVLRDGCPVSYSYLV
jgi:hypothetical protein